MNHMYSLIESKSLNDEKRELSGWATTGDSDRVGDIVDPFGVESAADIPLYLYHDSTKVVGRAKLGKATAKGVPFTAHLPNIKEDGPLKDLVSGAWGMVKYGLITAVSIGFRVLDGEVERMKNGGLKFKRTEVLELSLVPVPANASALITAIKSIDHRHLPPSSGQKAAPESVGSEPPGVTGNPKAASRGAVKLIIRKK